MKRAQRYKAGSIVLDRRRKTWNFLEWVNGKRVTRRIGTLAEFPTKAAAWQCVATIAEPKPKGCTIRDVSGNYQNERMPTRKSTARVYRSFLNTHILPRWGDTPIVEVQPRPIELWLRELKLSPKSKTHVRSLQHALVEFAMSSGELEVARNPISLVRNRGAVTRTRKARSLTAQQFHTLLVELHEPFATMALLCVCLGLRISEALALQWADVNWLEGKLSVRRGIVERNVDEVKTAGSARTFMLAPELLGVCTHDSIVAEQQQRALAQRREEKAPTPGSNARPKKPNE